MHELIAERHSSQIIYKPLYGYEGDYSAYSFYLEIKVSHSQILRLLSHSPPFE